MVLGGGDSMPKAIGRDFLQSMPALEAISGSGQKTEMRHVFGSHDREVPDVERRHRRNVQALGNSDHRCIDGAERKVAVAFDQVGHSAKVRLGERHEDEWPGRV